MMSYIELRLDRPLASCAAERYFTGRRVRVRHCLLFCLCTRVGATTIIRCALQKQGVAEFCLLSSESACMQVVQVVVTQFAAKSPE